MRKDLAMAAVALRGAMPAGVTPGDAAAILQSFNTWAYKREQPSDRAMLLEVIERCHVGGQPIRFVLYWGKGPRSVVAPPDHACLAYLDGMGQRIARASAPGARFTICLTDTHARLNGHGEEAIDSYFAGVDLAARARGMRTVRLSRVVAAYEAGAALGGASEAEVSAAMLGSLERCAAKWYRGGGAAEDGARRYLAMNMIERRAVEAVFPDTIFVTFNGRAYRDLFPRSMPIFYMYSLKRGTSVKPWFLDADGRPFAGVGDLAV